MKERIEELLEKYWGAETTLAEEQELRQILAQSTGFEKEKALFSAIDSFKYEEPKKLILPKAKTRKFPPTWISWAASVSILLGTFWVWRAYEQKQAEQQAYEQVMLAFELIQTNLSKGKDRLSPLNDLKYLNTTNQLFMLDESKAQ